MTPASSQAECLSAQSCYQLTGPFRGRYTPKDPAVCGCGSELRSLFQWQPTPNAWVDGAARWRQLSWRAREYKPRFKWGSGIAFNITGFDHDHWRIWTLLRAQQAETYTYCVAGQMSQLLGSLVCDCGGGVASGQQCFKSGQGELLGLKRVCTGIEAQLVLPNAQLLISATSTVASGCVDVLFYLQSATALYRHYSTVISSTFVTSLETNPDVVVPNNHHILVGRLRGDGVTLQFGSQVSWKKKKK